MAKLPGKIAFIFAFVVVQLVSFSGLAQAQEQIPFYDINKHWAKEEITEWIDKGLVSGYPDHTFQPNKIINRAEFISLVNKVFGYSHTGEQAFTDVIKEDWFYKDVAKAKYAGYISGFEDGSFRPGQPVSREQAAKIIYQLKQLEGLELAKATSSFQDDQQMSKWSKPYIKAVVSEGYMKGYPDQSFRPLQSITRAEAIAMLDNAAGELINKPGTYEQKTVVEGNMTINTDGVTVKNTTIKGDLVLAAGIGEGEVHLDRVTVEGRTIVNGGGENSVIIQDSTLSNVLVQKDFGRVRILAKGETVIANTIVKSGVKLEEEQQDKGFKQITVENVNENDLVQFDGKFEQVIVKSTAVIEVSGQSTITMFETQAGSEGSSIKLLGNAVLEQIILQAATKVTGQGTIIKAVINAEGSSFEQAVKEFVLSQLVKLVIIAGKEVTENSTSENSSGSQNPVSHNPSPGETTSPTTQQPVQALEAEGAFIVHDTLYAIFNKFDDYSTVKWNISSTVAQTVYHADYMEQGEDLGIFSITEGAIPSASYDVTMQNTAQPYAGVMLSSVTVSGEVYGYIHYHGLEKVSYQISGKYSVPDLANQLPDDAAPLVAGDKLTIAYGKLFILVATWNGSRWELKSISDNLQAPTNVTATTISNTEIRLQWNGVVDADHYHIYYSDKLDGTYTRLKDENGQPVEVAAASFVDGTNSPHTTRYYYVTAALAGEGAESAPSNKVYATTYYNAHIALDFAASITDTAGHPSEPIVYITDKANKKLYSVNYETGKIYAATFDFAPESLAYADGKVYVSLLKGEHSSYIDEADQQGAISVVEATYLSKLGTYDINIDPYDLAIDRSGYLYVASGSGQWTKLKSYALNTFAEAASSDIRQASYIQMHPVLNKLYAITTESSPRDISAYNVLNGQFVEPAYPGGYDSPYHGDYDMNTNFNISPDGKYIFNGSGNVFMATNNQYDDMKYVYGLEQDFSDIAFELGNKQFYTTKGNLVRVYDYGNFGQTGLYHADGTTKYLFNGADKLFAISTVAGKNVIEIIEKNTLEAVAPGVVSGIKLDGRVVDIAYDSVSNKAYAIDEAFHNLYVIDLQGQSVTDTVKLPYRPAGITLSEDGTSVYIVNDDLSYLVTEVRLSDLQTVRHLSFTSSPDSRDFSDRHIYHKSGLLYVVMGDWEPKLLVFNAATFATVNYGTTIKSVGELAFSSDKSKFYYWYQYGWDAGNAGSDVFAYSVSGNTFTKLGQSNLGYPDFYRDPLDTPVLVLENQGKLVVKNKVFNMNDVTQVVGTIAEPIYAVSPAGDVLVGKNGTYDAATYQKIEAISLGAATEIFFDKNGKLHYLLDGVLMSK